MRPLKGPDEQPQRQAIWNAVGIAAHGKARQVGGYSRETILGSAEPGDLFLGHDALDILGLALDAVARAAVGLDRQARDDRVDASFLHRSAALRALLLVMDVVIDRVIIGPSSVFPLNKGF